MESDTVIRKNHKGGLVTLAERKSRKCWRGISVASMLSEINSNPEMVFMKTINNILKLAMSAMLIHSWVACASSAEVAGQAGAANASEKDISAASSRPGTSISGAALSASKKTKKNAVAADTANVLRILLPNRVIYFPVGALDVSKGDLRLIHDHAKYLLAHKNRTVRLEGHTDERGSSEINLSLGQIRADSVKKILLMDGVNESQIESISYGEEHPVDRAHNESAWFKNRRIVFNYNAK